MSNQLDLKLGMIGFGNMAEAVLKGIVARGIIDPENMRVTEQSEARCNHLLATFAIKPTPDALNLLEQVDVVLFAVKPGNMKEVLAHIAPAARPDHLFLSVCAGIRTNTIEEALRSEKCPHPRVVRVMPNTPALIGEGMAGICGGANATDGDIEIPMAIFRAVGAATRVEESMMDAVTALTGSGPAYVFYLIESLIEGGVELGFEADQAKEMVLQMVYGAAKLARESDREPAELRRAVTSPGGTTAAGIATLDDHKVREAFKACLVAAEKRGRELGG
ncbi:MAG: pyrroline-5-carboxylate reductase [Candidatus Sumerlaeia bacterium]|nr:pyrroline-5-carboxylate reductase [Candidatus Sumerlaeia bacterium]